ncbi:ATP-dependent bile acid permease 3 [Colletotrichum chlorophyti]|uniref:ATP-dependent bile acid permease 3 n=1 Tax=Colletotrichum chlorophyti TaxID=708187 RepID=A0A1Q8RBI3_9PEZI|nr:ATP-dependent bile acid permease 3 [Colletotrichum chlorophyti]
MQDGSVLLIKVGAALGVVALTSVPAFAGLVRQIRTRKPKDHFYEDKDGKSTPEASAAFSNRRPKTFIFLFAFLGLAVSIANSILTTLSLQIGHYGSVFVAEWLATGTWALLALQAVAIVATNDSVHAYGLGLKLWFSGLVFTALQLLQNTEALGHLLKNNPVSFGLKIASLTFALALTATGVALPRRPDVFYEGREVDRLMTVPAYTRFTWGWCSGIINLATKKKDLEATDLPKPDYWTRSQDAASTWKSYNFKPGSNLWWAIIWAYRWPLFVQWSIAISKAFLSLAPSWITLQILTALQHRKPGEEMPANVWTLVFWLGLAILADAWVEAVMFWLSWAELCIPLRGALSALIFEKSMRRKNVKAASKTDAASDETDDKDDKKSDGEDKDGEAEEDDNVLKSKQAIINLIGVDARRISDFAAFQFLFPSSAGKLIVAIWFLVYLLGWAPLGAGLLAWAILLPINFTYAKVYSKAQDKLMKIRDQKLAVVNEALVGMRQIKFSALEPQWEKRILDMREKELGALWQVFRGDTVLYGMWITSPIALAAVSLATYAFINGYLTPAVAFVSIGVFKNLEVTLAVIPELITDVIDANISVKRTQDYLNGPEKTQTVTDGPDVAFENATIAWPVDEEVKDEDRFILRNVNLTFPAGELSVISGKTGSGKSLMLAAILGESDLLSGAIYAPKAPSLKARNDDKANRGNWIIPSGISFVGQIPWIENATLKSNILFGLPFDEERYNKTIEACALTKDLEMLADGDRTELGANGINLSGGQKWRLTLARAIYSRAGILVLDDIFSAVDAHVGRHIYEKCLTGELCKGRTRILVTHHVALCEPKTKFLVELGDGTVQHSGLLSELNQDGTLQLIKSHEQSAQEIADEEATAVNSEEASQAEAPEVAELNGDGGVLKKVPSKAARAFVEDETRETGSIKKHVYATYLTHSGGWPWWGFGCFLFVIYQFVIIGRSWWLRIWTGQSEDSFNASFQETQHQYAYAFTLQHSSLHVPSQSVKVKTDGDTMFYLGVYVAISAFSAILGTGRIFYFFVMSYKASRRLFEGITRTVLRTPLRWLDTVPTGRVLNRFTADFNVIDNRLGMDLAGAFGAVLSVLGICITAFYVSPLIIPLAFVLLLVAIYIAMRYLAGARPAKRLESTVKSPIFDLFGSTLVGIMTIRGADKAQTYIDAMYARLDDYGMASWYLWLFNRWMGWRMSLIGALFSTAVGFVVLGSPFMDAALAGFTLSFALEFSSAIVWSIRFYANIELDMNAAERVVEYSDLKTEDQGGEQPPASWPTEGRLEVKDLVISYADDLPPVLKGLTFSVNKNERIGVVGRTGAGKSSLTLALFRFLEARSGSIHVDGLDISKIKLHDLRSRLAIIPQDPVLFSGTVRSNLDPFDNQTDADLRDSLQRVHLVDSSPSTPSEPAASSSAAPSIEASQKNVNVFRNLNSAISEGGGNLSQGQRQLLCLARAIVSRPKVMVLDEATSAVDMTTDALIQRSIREEFNDSTLIVIAHRLSTIADFDRILVLSDGAVAEYGSPRELWDKEGGVFRGMCEESGEKDKLKNIIFG